MFFHYLSLGCAGDCTRFYIKMHKNKSALEHFGQERVFMRHNNRFLCYQVEADAKINMLQTKVKCNELQC